ncbi:beta-galactosidase [Paenibacillus sp. 598K]|uniref:beta-galactosidase n=1 Tax=Paenibacillus sp. 598K TaxID=1117987 RepID=UPI000FFE3C3D|nr:beta-galactosidase [Paenibacillus sp. 598K]
MSTRWTPVHPRMNVMLHGGDYNPDQWLDYPGILDEDDKLMKLARANTMSVNIFGWSALEPEEGVYRFEWLDEVMDRAAARGGHIILATPSGARPAWMSERYPEVLRVGANRVRNLHGLRHNHCYTSPVYREQTQRINRMLAERYCSHPALILWHISNEYGGDCHCELCQEAFRNWLKERYGHSLDKLNHAWWTGFWSHRFNSWSQIESPAPHGESQVHGLNLDWRRFVSDQTIDFYLSEIAPLRELTPDIPVTTNFMGNYPDMRPFTGLNYERFARHVDIVSWDAYPPWHNNWQSTAELARDVAFVNDLYRSLKGGRPFLIMECTPSLVNWHAVNKAKRPGMHKLSSLQSIAHGADSILYFQWRKGRGASEKFHGAVVDHDSRPDTRVFREVAEVGRLLERLAPVTGASVDAKVAILYDWENDWALADAQGFGQDSRRYVRTCQEHYRAFWERHIPVDVITPDQPLDRYALVIAPMLYMVREGFGQRVEDYVRQGGRFVATYATGMVDESDLAYLGGRPGQLREVLGIRAEEIDTLYPEETREVVDADGASYCAYDYCELVHLEGAQALAWYAADLYQGHPAVTEHGYGKGRAYYVAGRHESRYHDAFYGKLIEELGLQPGYPAEAPAGVSIQTRSDGEQTYVFIMNFTESEQIVQLPEGAALTDLETDATLSGSLRLPPYGAVAARV